MENCQPILLFDVLHHCEEPEVLLKEACRVARRSIIIKDHYLGRPLAGMTLHFMDWVGNRAHSVALPYNYWPEKRWKTTWTEMKLRPVSLQKELGLYPWPFSIMFELRLHFLVKLAK